MSAEYPPKEELEARRAGPDKDLRGRITAVGTGPEAAVPRERPNERRKMSAYIQRLAQRLGKNPDEIAAKIDPDTIRRTKYQVTEEPQPDGSILYKHNPVR